MEVVRSDGWHAELQLFISSARGEKKKDGVLARTASDFLLLCGKMTSDVGMGLQ